MTATLVEVAVRVAAFIAVFAVVAWRHPRIEVKPRWAVPLVGLVFALLNAGLYWLLKPVLNVATLGVAALVVPLVVNGVFLWATHKAVSRARVKLLVGGFRPALFLTLVLTATQGALYLAFDVLAK
jgi:hypothetical protein